jgi:glycosyltransferase involved in cell wall biosynthesis
MSPAARPPAVGDEDRGGAARGRPRLLIVITLAEVGGAQRYVAALLPALREEFDVVVAAHGDGPLRAAAEAAGVRLVALHHVRRPLNAREDMLGFVELVRLIRRERPAVVHANSSKAGVLGRLAAVAGRAPVRVFTVHGWAFRAHAGMASLAYLWADRLLSPLTGMTICVTQSDLDAGVRARTCRTQRATVIRNGIDLDVPRSRSHGGRPATIVSVARLRRPKDVMTLVRAVAMLEPGSVRALVVGDGPQRAELAAEIGRLRAERAVELLGERDDVAELLAGADVFVLSSASEGMPMCVLEAMAAALPVIASAVGGVPEIVRDGETGVLVPPGQPRALAVAIGALAADPALRRRLGEAGRRRVEADFDVASFRRAHVELYRSLLHTHVRQSPRFVAALRPRSPEGTA